MGGRLRGGIPASIGSRAVSGRAEGTFPEVQAGTASRKDAPSGIWSLCDQESERSRSREAGDIQLLGIHASYLRDQERQWDAYGDPAYDHQEAPSQAQRSES